ncbi:MAG: hypothetical protein QM750_02225 [Rubrivivax sp.]
MGNPAKAPVRLAVLDVDEDNEFTYADAIRFADAMVLAGGQTAFDIKQSLMVGGKKLDMTRFDLNADGKVGGAGTAKFNLDIDYGPKRESKYGMVSYSPLPASKVDLNENAVTDLQVLCYYIYSPLWRDTKGTRADVEAYLAAKVPQLSCVGKPVSAIITVNDVAAGWNGLPATINLAGFHQESVPSFQIQGNSATCGNQGEPPGERGSPLFSAKVAPGSQFYGATTVTGVPWPTSGGSVNRNNCSSFLAIKSVSLAGTSQVQAQVWVNATGRAVFGFGGAVVSDWEYQLRYYSGDPAQAYADRKTQLGVVPGSGIYQALLEPTQVTVTYVLSPP